MASTDFDVQIGSTKAKILRSEDGGYRRRTIRREVEQQLLSQSENPAMVSRADQRQLYQTSWAGGSRWWKPLLGAQEADSYFRSNHMDVWSEPGKIVPMNQVSDTADTNLSTNARFITYAGDTYIIGDTHNEDATGNDVYKWTPASDAFVRETGVHTTVGTAPRGLALSPNTDFIYYLHASGSTRFNIDTGDEGTRLTGQTVSPGANIFWQQGILVVYDGDTVMQDSGGNAVELFDDGLGRDFLVNMETSTIGGGTAIATQGSLDLAIGSPEGIYYVKNTLRDGQPVPFVFRVDKDDAGSWIGSPIGTLPVGHVALSVAYHLGSVVISTTPNWRGMLQNSTTNHVEVSLFFVDQNGMGSLGSMLGGRDQIDETPYKFLYSSGSLLYIGGHKRLWVYDATRGGLHSVFEFPTASTVAPYSTMSIVENSSGEQIAIWAAKDRYATAKLSQYDDPDTVTDFGDDETHYVITSNYFDGGLPMETKELTKVQIQHGELDDSGNGEDSNQEWTVQIAADGGSFSDALVNSEANSTSAEADLSGTTGRRFQYRLIYQTKDTERIPLEGLLVSFTTGEMVTEWDLTLDGDELLNVDNEVQDEQAFYDALVTLAGTSTITTLMDNMQEQAQLTDTGTTTNVRVQAVEISKTKPGESMIRVVLREAA